jgi:hypothetical protein
MSFDPVRSEEVPSRGNLLEKLPEARLPMKKYKKYMHSMLFYGKNLMLFVFMSEPQLFCKSRVPNG